MIYKIYQVVAGICTVIVLLELFVVLLAVLEEGRFERATGAPAAVVVPPVPEVEDPMRVAPRTPQQKGITI